MDKDDDPQDLSQNLLDDKITKELIFTGADDNSISTTLVVKKPRLSNLTEELSITNSMQTSIPPGGLWNTVEACNIDTQDMQEGNDVVAMVVSENGPVG